MILQILAFVTLSLFYGCYFIKLFSQRRKGILTDQIGKGKTGTAQKIEITMKAAALLALAVEILSILMNTHALPLPIRAAGCCTGFAGTGFFILSVWTMHDSWRAGVSKTDQTELVTEGIYQISRNPAFLGFDLLYIGILLIFFNWFLLVISAFAIGMLHLQIICVEEAFLRDTFGDAYLCYQKRVKRYLGKKR